MTTSLRLPDFMIIGAQKAATTTLADALRNHPDAWLPAHEDHYFHDPVFHQIDVAQFADRYSGHRESRLGLKCPDYLGRPEVPARVRSILGAPKLVVCLRNPVDRAVSAYFWYMRWGVIPLRHPNEGIVSLLRGDYDEIPMARQILEYGEYARHIGHWFAHFEREQFLILLHEDIRADAHVQMYKLATFLDLDPSSLTGSTNTTSNRGIYPLGRLRFVQLRNRWLRQWDPMSTHLSLVRPTTRLPRLMSNAVAGIDRYVLEPLLGNTVPQLSVSVREQLRSYYAADVSVLQQLLGRSLQAWR